MDVSQNSMRLELEKCLITWAHARRDIEELHRLNTPGARAALALVFRIMIIGEKEPRVLASIEDSDVPALAEAIACTVRRRNASFGYDPLPPMVVEAGGEEAEPPSRWLLRENIGVYLEVTWFGQRASQRLLRMESPEARYATWLVQRIYTAGESISDVMHSVKNEELPGLLAALDSALTDYPDVQRRE